MPNLPAEALSETSFATVDVLLHSQTPRARRANVLVFRYRGRLYAYVNHCMHMHRPLNCQEDAVFDPERRWLRCSMHGFIFEPDTGICRSPVCEGQALQAVKVAEEDGLIVFKEKQLQVLAVHAAKAAPGGEHA
ncbi:Rieske (2Fe-2S) protein [Methylomonas rivi]|uniref:Rieske 2Fe-2S domain-containing protein n=1 Tax=Methylomonas rivi TaxID=2952226 RepID=A0ABT1U8P7_9GAMM|nr:Rieske 2Fe-2S domain-containing protein [Methylomonas sp. WSC-6]MCQ8130180.1 Rieske 2Fe-2S domain-containing protein [Methylomonas sp. WSC-6]